MRFVLALALAFASACVFAEAAPPAAASAKAFNATCCCGKPVDPKVASVEAKSVDGHTVHIGCCSDACATIVKKDPAKSLEKLQGGGKSEAKKDEKAK